MSKKSKYIPKALRARVSAQSRYRCGYCLTREDIIGMPMQILNLIPSSLDGPTPEDNLWLACSLCNNHKNDRTSAIDPQTGQFVLYTLQSSSSGLEQALCLDSEWRANSRANCHWTSYCRSIGT